jgi:hypothetical protein
VQYDTSGHAVVTFDFQVTVQTGCAPVTLQRDFGDGTPLAPPQTFGVGQGQAYTDVHTYAAGHTYTSSVNVLSRPSCAPTTTTLTINPPPPCSVIPFVVHICTWAKFLFLVNGAAGAVSFLAGSTGCSAVNPALLGIAGAFSSAALIFLAIILFGCLKCACRLPLKLLGQLLLVCGVLLCMFIVQPTCLQIPGSVLGIIILTLLVFLVGFTIVLQAWYSIGCCKLTICDYWQAVAEAMTAAFVAAPLVFFAVTPAGVSPLGLGLSLLVAYLIAIYAGVQISISQGAHLC